MESFKQLNSTFWPPHGPASTGFGVPKPRRHRFLSHSLRGVLNDSSGISDQLHQIVVKSLTNTCSTHKLIARERCNIMQDPSGFDWPSALGLGMLGGSGDSGDHWWPLVTTGDSEFCFDLFLARLRWLTVTRADSSYVLWTERGRALRPWKTKRDRLQLGGMEGGRRNTKDGCFEAKTFFDMFGYCLIFLKYVLSELTVVSWLHCNSHQFTMFPGLPLPAETAI